MVFCETRSCCNDFDFCADLNGSKKILCVVLEFALEQCVDLPIFEFSAVSSSKRLFCVLYLKTCLSQYLERASDFICFFKRELFRKRS